MSDVLQPEDKVGYIKTYSTFWCTLWEASGQAQCPCVTWPCVTVQCFSPDRWCFGCPCVHGLQRQVSDEQGRYCQAVYALSLLYLMEWSSNTGDVMSSSHRCVRTVMSSQAVQIHGKCCCMFPSHVIAMGWPPLYDVLSIPEGWDVLGREPSLVTLWLQCVISFATLMYEFWAWLNEKWNLGTNEIANSSDYSTTARKIRNGKLRCSPWQLDYFI